MKLIIARPSPFARKVRVALIEKNIECDIEVDNPWLPETGVANANPLGKVPALILDDGSAVHDSKVIVEYLETLDAPPSLIPADPRVRVQHKQIEAIADGICDAVVLVALEGARPVEKQSGSWLQRQKKKISAGVTELEQKLGGREWFTSSGFGLAEIATVCALDYVDFRFAEYDWRPVAPGLVNLHARNAQRVSFGSTMPQPQALPSL